jgi:hypothetical protein
MSEHFKELCSVCGTVISQCRCPSENKVLKYDICDLCKLTMDHWKQTEILHCPEKNCKGMLLSNPDFNYHKCSNCHRNYLVYLEIKELKEEENGTRKKEVRVI